ncbi:hypothetical protein ULMS_05720 [Patiriisocius marinistellae]|uniref:Uncharacterized protein n=1 Tax=Patiriisocius marinistellae TaxID=2494560 RepID=A0A5J4FVE7_9FLAO|nr:tetratricopeptide repeat protein [Patiriisocius marinistellae]GEQ85064.1 hypothetical protein ULMS_05720 [Patiriisocius marinistellae]
MKNSIIKIIVLILLLNPIVGSACSMYKITRNGKTIVGNNEDWLSPNSKFWFETGTEGNYGVMYMGQLDNFAQGAINDAGLVFDGFANPDLPINNATGKIEIPIGDAIKNIMQTMSTAEEVKLYLETINLSSLESSQIVFVDTTGTYLIVEGDALIIGEEEEKAFSNFYYSQIESEEDVELENFKQGMEFLKTSKGDASISYCGDVMQSMSSEGLFGTQYSTVYDLNTLTVRVYLFHDYSQFVDIDLKEQLEKDNHAIMIADLFSKNSKGHQHYAKYNDEENPQRFLSELVATSLNATESEFVEMGLNGIVNMVGYEWLKQKNNPEAAIKVFKFGIELTPSDADLHDSLGEAYFENKNYALSKLSYEKSLALNPNNKNAKTFLAKIETKKF